MHTTLCSFVYTHGPHHTGRSDSIKLQPVSNETKKGGGSRPLRKREIYTHHISVYQGASGYKAHLLEFGSKAKKSTDMKLPDKR